MTPAVQNSSTVMTATKLCTDTHDDINPVTLFTVLYNYFIKSGEFKIH